MASQAERQGFPVPLGSLAVSLAAALETSKGTVLARMVRLASRGAVYLDYAPPGARLILVGMPSPPAAVAEFAASRVPGEFRPAAEVLGLPLP